MFRRIFSLILCFISRCVKCATGDTTWQQFLLLCSSYPMRTSNSRLYDRVNVSCMKVVSASEQGADKVSTLGSGGPRVNIEWCQVLTIGSRKGSSLAGCVDASWDLASTIVRTTTMPHYNLSSPVTSSCHTSMILKLSFQPSRSIISSPSTTRSIEFPCS